jgi:hypothetical protein
MPETAGSTPYHLAVIIADLQEMIRIADDAPEKLGTLAWLLECALIEAKRLAECTARRTGLTTAQSCGGRRRREAQDGHRQVPRDPLPSMVNG